MSFQPVIDCIIVGYNDISLDAFGINQGPVSGGIQHEMKCNSVIFNGKRMLYMDLLSDVIAQGTGQNPQLNVFKTPSLAVCHLQNYLQQRNYNVETVNFFTYEKAKLKQLLAQSPRSVAITTTFYTDNSPIIEIVKFVRKHNSETKIIVGGPHIYNIYSDYDEISQGYVFEEIGADIYITDSQGENTLSQVVGQLKNGQRLNKVPNLVYFNGRRRRAQRTMRQVERNDMDHNSIRWETFDQDVITPLAYMRTARSCPFSCLFCNYPTLAGAHVLSSLETVEREFDKLYEAGTKVIVFIDDTFNVPLPRFKKIMRLMIEKEYNFKWVSFLRCSNVDELAMDLMKESGCIGVLLGIESGDEIILKNMNKKAKARRYKWGIEQLNKRGISSYASLICGFPGETEETVKNTINFIEETKPTFYNVQLYYHDHRAPIHQQAKKYGIRGGGYNWRHKTMDWRSATKWAMHMYKNIHSSIPIPVFGFSMWGVAYLVSQGLTLEQIKTFGKIVQEPFIPSLDGIAIDCTDQERRLVELFKDVSIYDPSTVSLQNRSRRGSRISMTEPSLRTNKDTQSVVPKRETLSVLDIPVLA